MNITFMIGNGFDVGVGLKSKFSDYFPIYCTESENKSESLKGLADEINGNEDKWSYFERQLGLYTEKFDEKNKMNFIKQIKDFEIGFINYLKRQQSLLLFDDIEGISETLRKAFNDLYDSSNLPRESSNIIRNLYNIYGGKHGHTFNFINFNYTEVLQKCLSSIKNGVISEQNNKKNVIGKITHVHGTMDYRPLMGVDNIEQISNKVLSEDKNFAKYIVKPILNEKMRTGFANDAKRMILNSQLICIYGMSIGETDKTWWGSVLSWLSSDPNRQLIIFDYDESYNEASQFDCIEKEENIREKFLHCIQAENINIDELMPRIHIAVHKNIFKMNLCKKKIIEIAT